MKREFRVIRNNGKTTNWIDLDGWDIHRLNIFAEIMCSYANDWQIEYRVVEGE